MINNTTIIYNPSDNHWDERDYGPSLSTRIAFACAWILIAICGITGNGLVIYIAVRFQKLNNVTNCFIVNLAITDIVFLVFCMPLLVVQYTLDVWLFSELFCKLLNLISFVSVLVTVLTLVTMTIDRYIYVVRPFENLQWRKPKTVLLMSTIIWLISCIFASPFYYQYGLANHDNNYQCVLLSDEELQRYFCIYTITLYYFIPLIIIIISYTKLLYFIYTKENRLRKHTKFSGSKRSKKRRAVTKMVAIVTLVFSLCWLPITIYIILAYIFPQQSKTLYYYKIIANSFAYLNSAINPILYAFLNRSFRTNCGTLFFQKPFSETISDDPRQSRQQTSRKCQASTQIDRFSYQSTNNQSTSPTRDTKKKQLTILSNNTHLSSPIVECRDYSDVQDETLDGQDTSSVPNHKNSPQFYFHKEKPNVVSAGETDESSTVAINL